MDQIDGVNLFSFLYREPGTDVSWFNSVSYEEAMVTEFERQGVALSSRWRVTRINVNYELCETYPSILAVPQNQTDDDLIKVRYRKCCVGTSAARDRVLWYNPRTQVGT